MKKLKEWIIILYDERSEVFRLLEGMFILFLVITVFSFAIFGK